MMSQNNPNNASTKKLQVGDKLLTISKWKGKTKKEFIKEISKSKDEYSDSRIQDILVYSCIEENVVLTEDEFRFVLSRIRAFSLGEEINIEFYCPKCEETFEKTYNISDIIKSEYKELKTINVQGIKIQLTNIKNKEFFYKKIQEDNIYEFLLKIESFNDDDTLTLEQLEEKLEELDIDVLENILEIYEDHKFKINDLNEVQCECGNKMLFEFDELPGFFPENWFGK